MTIHSCQVVDFCFIMLCHSNKFWKKILTLSQRIKDLWIQKHTELKLLTITGFYSEMQGYQINPLLNTFDQMDKIFRDNEILKLMIAGWDTIN